MSPKKNPNKGKRVLGTDRERMAAQLAEGYNAGMSIRELATEHQRSYGFIHRVLLEAGTALRGRGTQPGRVAK